VADWYNEYQGRPEFWGVATREPKREPKKETSYPHGWPGSIENFTYRQSLIPNDIQELLAGEQATAIEIRDLLAEISDWKTLSESLTEPVQKIAKWLVEYVEIPKLQEELRRTQYQADVSRYKRQALEKEYESGEWGGTFPERITGGPSTRLAEIRQEYEKKGGAGLTREPETEYPVEDWMKPYLESSMRLGKEGTAYQLRPLGAQSKTTLDQLGELKGYHTWGQAGAPLSFEDYAKAGQNMESWWEEYQRLSKSLFPTKTGVMRTNWYPRKQ